MQIDETKQKFIFIAIGIIVLGIFAAAIQNVTKPKKIQKEVAEVVDEGNDYELERRSLGSARNMRSGNTSRSVASTNSKSLDNLAGFKEDKAGDMLRASGNSQIYGTIMNQERVAIPGATVYMLPFPLGTEPTLLRTVQSDEKGSYTLPNLNDESMRYTVIAQSTGMAATRRDAYLRKDPVQLDITLQPGRTIKGMVRDASTSTPLPGAKVFLPDYYPVTEGESANDGTFSFDNMPQEPMRIAATKEGYPEKATMTGADRMGRRGVNIQQMQQMAQRFMPAGMAESIAFDVNNVVISLSPGGATVKGIIVDNTGKPVSGAKVRIATAQNNFMTQLAYPAMQRTGVATREDGLFEVKGVPSGVDLNLTAIRGMEGPPVTVNLQPNEVKDNIELKAPSPLLVSGRVIYIQDSRPVPGAELGYDTATGRKTVLSDDKGEFIFQTLTNESKYKIYIEVPCMAPVDGEESTTEVAKFIERTVPKNSASDNVTIKMKTTAAIEGTVTNTNGQPAKFITVKAAHQTDAGIVNSSTQTNHLGEYFFNMPDEKSTGQTSIIYARTNREAAMKATKRGAKRKTVDLKMENSSVRGTLKLSDETSLDGVSIQILYTNDGLSLIAEATTSGRGGNFNVPIEKSGNVTMLFSMPDGELITQTFSGQKIANTQTQFIYDPVNKTVTTKAGGGRGGNRGQGGNNRGPGGRMF